MTGPGSGKAALVVGASRGIGRAVVAEMMSKGYETVFAASRAPSADPDWSDIDSGRPNRLERVPLDVTNETSIALAADRIGSFVPRLHRIVVCAGFLHDAGYMPERRLEHINPQQLLRAFEVNSVGPMLVAKHFLPLLRHEEPAVLAALSARVGSIGDNRMGGWYGYRASKAAQNMLMKTLSVECKRRAPNLICVNLHPGTVDTDLSAPFASGIPREERFSPPVAASLLTAVMDSLRSEDSGRFFAWDRKEIPW